MGEAEPIAAFNDVRTIDDPKVNSAFTEMFRQSGASSAPRRCASLCAFSATPAPTS